MGRFDGKVALITGGARGQGAAEARLFVAEGAKVFLSDVLDAEGGRTAAEVGGAYLHHDVTQEPDWMAVVDRVVGQAGRLDILVNNAGRRASRTASGSGGVRSVTTSQQSVLQATVTSMIVA
jgi:3alpha(or 20beta)-hydroxysteroid dehydrogenase